MKKLFLVLITLSAFLASTETFAQSNEIYSQTNGVLSAELQAAYQYGQDIGYNYGFSNNQAGLNAALLDSTPPVVYGASGNSSQHVEMYRMGLNVGFSSGYNAYLINQQSGHPLIKNFPSPSNDED